MAGAMALILVMAGCENNVSGNRPVKTGEAPTLGKDSVVSASQVNLVADNSSFSGARVDPNLLNAWGIAVTPTGIF